jgi:hypothetical protein
VRKSLRGSWWTRWCGPQGAGLLLALVLVTTLSCGKLSFLFGNSPPMLAVVFVDLSASASADDWRIYEGTYDRLLATLRPGDRLVLSEISDRTLTGAVFLEDREFPVTGVSLDDVEAADTLRTQLRERFGRVRDVGRAAQRSCIVSALEVARGQFAADRQRTDRVILILSDMIEDCAGLDLMHGDVSDAGVQSAVQQLRREGRLPDLSVKALTSGKGTCPGVRVYVAGAAAPDEKRLTAIRHFWTTLFSAAGATCDEGMYQRQGPHFARASGR